MTEEHSCGENCGHKSDCSLHNEPAERNGPCSCGQSDNKVTIPFTGGPMEGDERTLPSDKVLMRIDVLGVHAGVPSGRYELRYVWRGESEEWYCRGCLAGKDGRDCADTCGCPCHGKQGTPPSSSDKDTDA